MAASKRENFCHSAESRGRIKDERSGVSLGNGRWPVPYSADG
jgi:hypothetical protein